MAGFPTNWSASLNCSFISSSCFDRSGLEQMTCSSKLAACLQSKSAEKHRVGKNRNSENHIGFMLQTFFKSIPATPEYFFNLACRFIHAQHNERLLIMLAMVALPMLDIAKGRDRLHPLVIQFCRAKASADLCQRSRRATESTLMGSQSTLSGIQSALMWRCRQIWRTRQDSNL